MGFQSGFVTLIGRPNVGKSTLLNCIMGEKISIMSPKPQTTRNRIRAIYTEDECQIIFIDTPGIHKPRTRLGEYMVGAAEKAMEDVDACLFLVEATETEPTDADKEILEQLKAAKIPVILIINKVDLVKRETLLALITKFTQLMEFAAVIPLSALKRKGVEAVLEELLKILPEGPLFYEDDIATDQTEKEMVAEIVREKILRLTNDEVPHGTGVEIISFKVRPDGKIIDIDATIYCERDSHKAILIGKQGAKLKQIGTFARQECEKLLDAKVNLKLWVKVKSDWRNSPTMLKTLGYRDED